MVDKFLSSRWAKFLFAISVVAFTGLHTNTGSIIVMALNISAAFVLALFLECKYKILSKAFKIKSRKYALIALPISIYTIIEIMLSSYNSLNNLIVRIFISENPLAHEMRSLLPEQIMWIGLYMFLVAAGVITFFVVFVAVYAIVSRFKRIATIVWQRTDKLERVYLVAAVLTLGIFVAVVYDLSPVFWGDNSLPRRGFGLIYGLDIGRNIAEADDGQFVSTRFGNIKRLFYPLVNLPFALTARALGRILFFVPLAYVYFLQLFHITLMACGGIFLARMCNIAKFSKKYFLALYTVSYSFLLFSIPLERYVLPTFCVILLMYVCTYVPKHKYAVALAAAGTLTTSLVLLPFVAFDRKIKTWFFNLLKLVGAFAAICILYGKLPILYRPIQAVLWQLNSFAGGVSTEEKALQFINFVASIFVKPETTLIYKECRTDAMDYVSAYALAVPVFVNWIGVVLIALIIGGFIINRKFRFAQMSFLWVVFAFFILFVMGWQARENEMFLSSFYFGWAFFVLVFMFFEKLLEKQKIIKYAVYSVMLVVMAIININGIIELVRFGIEHYPAR